MVQQLDAMKEALKLHQELTAALPHYVDYAYLVGSCAIQTEGNDIDVMIVCHDNPDGMAQFQVAAYLTGNGWTEQTGDEEEYGPGDFRSFRNGDVNGLLVWSKQVARKWIAAVEVCKYVSTTTREQRVGIHRIIMDGKSAHEADY